MSEEELEALLDIGCCEYHRDIGIEAKKEIERLNNIINKAIEELEIWQPKEKVLQEEKEYLLDILKGVYKE